jgi:hypothetical protein
MGRKKNRTRTIERATRSSRRQFMKLAVVVGAWVSGIGQLVSGSGTWWHIIHGCSQPPVPTPTASAPQPRTAPYVATGGITFGGAARVVRLSA